MRAALMNVGPRVALQLSAPFMPKVKDHDDKNERAGGGKREREHQSRVLNPSDHRNAERHDQTEQAQLPGQHVRGRREGAERQQSVNCEVPWSWR